MKQYNGVLFKVLGISCLLLIHFSSNAQLSGNYTINPLASASSTNYQNWASVASDLISGTRTDGGTAQGSGVSGSVIFTVYDTIYSNTQFKLTAISGASASNSITFKSAGGDSTACVLQFASGTATTNDYVLMLDGADYINFHQIGFERTGNSAYYTVIQLLNSADYNSITNCWMKTRKLPSNVTTGWTTGIGAQIFLSGNADYNQFFQNKMIYGYNGIYSTTASTGNSISRNSFDTLGCIGVYVTQQTGLQIERNIFSMGDFGSGQGHYISYAIRIESSPTLSITKNKIYMLATNAQVVRGLVFVSVTGTASAPNLINNNWIYNAGGTSSCTCMSMYGISYLDLYYNNFLITNSLAAGAVIHHNATYTNTYVNVKNNNLINKGGGLVYDFPSTNGGLDTVVNNNCYATGSVLGKMNSTSYSSLSAWISGTSLDANSLNIDPGYISNSDLHVSSIGLNGKAVPYFRVGDDIDDDTRHATTPDIGADEFYPVANDAGISSLDSPYVFCAGLNNIKIIFQNYGYDTLKNLIIQWQINNNTPSSYSWSGTVDPGSSSSLIQLGNFTFAHNTAYNFKIWTKNPNNVSDGNNQNDTLYVTRYAGMSGNYSIGQSSTNDFQSFNNAISAMTSRGICGSVVINVDDAHYYEQITLAELPGMGATSPITFKSTNNDSSLVVIELPSSTATGNNNAAVQLVGADYVTFKGMTFLRTGSNNISEVVHILNGSHHNTFTNCQMINTYVTTNNATGINIWSDQGVDDSNSFLYNYVKFGTYNMLFHGTTSTHESGTTIIGNIFDSAYSSSVQIAYNDGVVINGNTFLNSISNVANNYDLQLLDCDSANAVVGNYFYNGKTDVGIHQSGCTATATSPGITANNFIAKSGITAILLDGVNHQKIVFNSINLTGTSTTNAGILTSSTSSANIVMKNNNIILAAGSVFNIYSASHISGSNRNNLKTQSSQFAYWGAAYSSLANLQTATAKDANSMSVDPQYVSSTDLHYTNYALRNAGEPINGISTDIDGENRNPTNPDIGADELPPVTNDAGIVSLISPSAVVCEGNHQVEVVLMNYGSNNLTNATLNWKVNNSSQSPYSWTGNLATNQPDTVVLGNFYFTGNTNPGLTIWSSSPNGQTDGFVFNDTLIISRQINSQPTANAGADADLCPGDSVLIGPNPVSGYSYTWMTLSSTVIGTNAQIYVMPSSNSTYVLEVTDIAGGCSSTDTLDVIIRSLPSSGFTVNNNNQCLNGNVFSFTNTSSAASTYLWDFGDNDTSTAMSPSHTYVTADTFTAVLTAISMYGCIDTSSLTLTVQPKPGTCISHLLHRCLHGNSFSFKYCGTGSVSNFWDFGDGTYSTALNPAPKSYQYIGSYDVKLVTTSSIGCQDSVTTTAYVKPHPKSSFIINDSDQCLSGNNFVFHNTSTGSSSFFWDFGNNNTSFNTPTSNTYTLDGSYSVKLISTTVYGCKDSATKLVHVRPHPISAFTSNDSSQCLSVNNFVFSNTSSGSVSSLWSFGDATFSGINSPTHSYLQAGTFPVKLVSNSSYGCKDSLIKDVYARPEPRASIFLNDTGQCFTGNLFYFYDNSYISSGSIKNYFWDLADGNFATSKHSNHSYLNEGIFTIKHVVTSNYGCKDSILKPIVVSPEPIASFNINDDEQCKNNNQFIFTNTSSLSSGSMDYLWDLGDGNQNSQTNNTHSYGSASTFVVKLVVTSNMQCVNSVSHSIGVIENPVVYLGEDDSLIDAETIILDAGLGFDSYLWSNNATGSQITVDSASFPQGVNTIWVQVSKDDCEGYDSILISILRSTSISDEKTDLLMKMYPNPVSKTLFIVLRQSTEKLNVSLVDVYGREIRNLDFNTTNTIQLDVSNLASGIYYLNMTNDKIKSVHKFIKY